MGSFSECKIDIILVKGINNEIDYSEVYEQMLLSSEKEANKYFDGPVFSNNHVIKCDEKLLNNSKLKRMMQEQFADVGIGKNL